MTYQLLIVDDEPLVQVGLRTMLSRGFDDIEIIGTASNGRDALQLITEQKPDIVISDIKMPIMTGLELIAACDSTLDPAPAFIMLTAYEEFDMVRQALSHQAVDYLVKLELDMETLTEALMKAKKRVDQQRPVRKETSGDTVFSGGRASLEAFRQRFMLRLLNHQITDAETLEKEARDVGLDFHYNRYICIYGALCPDSSETPAVTPSQEKSLARYEACISMASEILERFAPCYIVSIDPRHFCVIFFFGEEAAVSATMDTIREAVENVHDMILSYFNVPCVFGIGTAVSDAAELSESFEEARTAQENANEQHPIRLFSHLVGANRRSGKDKLITAIQEYINDNLNGKLQLNDIADAFGLSPAYLSVLFKKNMDIGFAEYVYTKKIERAKEMLLSDDMKIYEVADALGFESAYYFSKVFKKVTGFSPREFIQSKS